MYQSQLLPDDLAGCTVLVASADRNEQLIVPLEHLGASVHTAPVLSVAAHIDDHELISATLDLIETPPYATLITSSEGVRGWFEAAEVAGVASALRAVLCRSELLVSASEGAAVMVDVGVDPAFVDRADAPARIVEMLLRRPIAGQSIAVQHHGQDEHGIVAELNRAGAQVHDLAVYRWGTAPDEGTVGTGVQQVARGEVEAVVFTAVPAVTAFLAASRASGLLDEVVAQCGPQGSVVAVAAGQLTARGLNSAGIRPLLPRRPEPLELARVLIHELVARWCARIKTTRGELRLTRRLAELDGEPLTLSATALAVLRALVAAGGLLVSRERLMAATSDTVQSVADLERAIDQLVESLGCDKLVQTIAGRGYRLNVEESYV